MPQVAYAAASSTLGAPLRRTPTVCLRWRTQQHLQLWVRHSAVRLFAASGGVRSSSFNSGCATPPYADGLPRPAHAATEYNSVRRSTIRHWSAIFCRAADLVTDPDSLPGYRSLQTRPRRGHLNRTPPPTRHPPRSRRRRTHFPRRRRRPRFRLACGSIPSPRSGDLPGDAPMHGGDSGWPENGPHSRIRRRRTRFRRQLRRPRTRPEFVARHRPRSDGLNEATPVPGDDSGWPDTSPNLNDRRRLHSPFPAVAVSDGQHVLPRREGDGVRITAAPSPLFPVAVAAGSDTGQTPAGRALPPLPPLFRPF